MADESVVSDVKRYMQVTGDDDNQMIEDIIDSVQSIVETYVGWEIFRGIKDYSEYHHGGGNKKVVLRRWPVVSITNLWDDLERLWGDDTKIRTDDYAVDTISGIIELDGDLIFATGNLNVRVDYKAGYDKLPFEIMQVRREETARVYHRAKQGGDGISSERQGPYSVNYEDMALSKRSMLILGNYRSRELG